MTRLDSERREAPERHGVIFALVKEETIQLEERLEPGKWFGLTIIPGGHVEKGETLVEAMLREAKEEYGIIPSEYKKLGLIITSGDDLNLHIKHVYLVTNWMGQLVNIEGRNKHIAVGISEAERICTHPISQRTLEMVKAELLREHQ